MMKHLTLLVLGALISFSMVAQAEHKKSQSEKMKKIHSCKGIKLPVPDGKKTIFTKRTDLKVSVSIYQQGKKKNDLSAKIMFLGDKLTMYGKAQVKCGSMGKQSQAFVENLLKPVEGQNAVPWIDEEPSKVENVVQCHMESQFGVTAGIFEIRVGEDITKVVRIGQMIGLCMK